jgi:hypothetical protein
VDDAPKTTDEQLAALLAGGLSVVKAAKKANLCERTVRRRLATPEFRELLAGLRSEAVERAAAILGKSMAGSALELIKLRTKSKDERVRLTAAKELLGSGVKVRQIEELQREIGELTARLLLVERRKGKR